MSHSPADLDISGYALAECFKGKNVRVYTVTSRVLTGKILEQKGNSILIEDRQTLKRAYVNLDHIVTITCDN